LTNNSL